MNIYHELDCAVNLISVAQLFKIGANVQFSMEYYKIKIGRGVITATSRNGCWFLDAALE